MGCLLFCCVSQWECRTDMDNTHRFGHIEVSCEGYSHPADAYILKGSCGLEYTLELTEEGQRRSHSSRGSRDGFKGRRISNAGFHFYTRISCLRMFFVVLSVRSLGICLQFLYWFIRIWAAAWPSELLHCRHSGLRRTAGCCCASALSLWHP